MNAFELMEQQATLLYAEGLAMRRGESFPFPHAWCVEDDVVIEPTLRHPNRFSYFGIAVAQSTVIEITMRQETYGILDGDLVACFIASWRAGS